MTLYLVRHGLASAGTEDLDPGLAETGHAQARAAATALAGSGALRLVVSPLRRTRETAIPIGQQLGLPQEIREEVAEVFDPSMPPEERRAMIGPFMAGTWSERSEALRAWRERVAAALADLAAGPSPVVVVS
ncbi:MAG: histidine phosphatase family protein, partial [Dehalococcoidia bacterium]